MPATPWDPSQASFSLPLPHGCLFSVEGPPRGGRPRLPGPSLPELGLFPVNPGAFRAGPCARGVWPCVSCCGVGGATHAYIPQVLPAPGTHLNSEGQWRALPVGGGGRCSTPECPRGAMEKWEPARGQRAPRGQGWKSDTPAWARGVSTIRGTRSQSPRLGFRIDQKFNYFLK